MYFKFFKHTTVNTQLCLSAVKQLFTLVLYRRGELTHSALL